MAASNSLFDSRGRFSGSSYPMKTYSRDRGSKGRCHGNHFWDYISCTWTLTGDNDMRISYRGWFVFSQPLHLLVALSAFVVAAIGTAPGGRLSGWELTR